MRVEGGADRATSVDAAKRCRDPADDARLLHLLDGNRPAGDEAGHQPAFGGNQADDLGTDAGRRGPDAGLVFGEPVDAQLLGVAARHPEHEGFAVDVDPEVAVGDPSRQDRDGGSPAWPEPLDSGGGLHSAGILTARRSVPGDPARPVDSGHA